MEDEGIAPITYGTAHLIQLVWAESHLSTQHSVHCTVTTCLSIGTGSAVCIWCHSLAFHFVGSSIYLPTTPPSMGHPVGPSFTPWNSLNFSAISLRYSRNSFRFLWVTTRKVGMISFYNHLINNFL